MDIQRWFVFCWCFQASEYNKHLQAKFFDQIIVLNKNEFCNSFDSIITYADPNFYQLNMYKESMIQKHIA